MFFPVIAILVVSSGIITLQVAQQRTYRKVLALTDELTKQCDIITHQLIRNEKITQLRNEIIDLFRTINERNLATFDIAIMLQWTAETALLIAKYQNHIANRACDSMNDHLKEFDNSKQQQRNPIGSYLQVRKFYEQLQTDVRNLQRSTDYTETLCGLYALSLENIAKDYRLAIECSED